MHKGSKLNVVTTLTAVDRAMGLRLFLQERAKDAVQELLVSLSQVNPTELEVPLRELTSICDQYPALLTEKLVKEAESYTDLCSPNAKQYLHHLRNEFNTIRY
jgi:hypothetical protein